MVLQLSLFLLAVQFILAVLRLNVNISINTHILKLFRVKIWEQVLLKKKTGRFEAH